VNQEAKPATPGSELEPGLEALKLLFVPPEACGHLRAKSCDLAEGVERGRCAEEEKARETPENEGS
jgi:hypothetical protein